MTNNELEDIYRMPSNFGQEALDAATKWADEIRAGLYEDSEKNAEVDVGNNPVSLMAKLGEYVAPLGVTSMQSIAELAFIGLKISRQKQMEESNG
jgi:hypothetical protein